MQYARLPLFTFKLSFLIYLLLMGLQPHAVAAHTRFESVVNDLFYPRESERFFREGQRQLETEVETLRRSSTLQPPTLNINEDVLQQQEMLRQEQERNIEEILQQSDRNHQPL